MCEMDVPNSYELAVEELWLTLSAGKDRAAVGRIRVLDNECVQCAQSFFLQAMNENSVKSASCAMSGCTSTAEEEMTMRAVASTIMC